MSQGNHRTCEICGLRERHRNAPIYFARFPLNETRCREWVKVTGKEDLIHLPIEKLNQLKRVCANHFQKEDFRRKTGRLKMKAIPSKDLLLPPLLEEQLVGFPLHVASHVTGQPGTSNQPDEVMLSTQPGQLDSVQPRLLSPLRQQGQPGTSNQPDEVILPTQPGQLDSVQPGLPNQLRQQGQPGTSKQPDDVILPIQQGQLDSEQPGLCNQLRQQDASTTKDQNSPMKRKRPSVIIHTDATPRKRRLLRQLQATKCKLASLKKSTKLIESLESTVLKELIDSAFRNQKRKPQGKRYTTQQKISALAIFKRSPKAYKYLEKLIPLPSIKTLHHVLRKIPLEPGISPSVLKHLKKISSDRDLKNRLCVLCFDEMALKPRLVYNIATDKVEGYQDLGDCPEGRSEALADHALVFLLQGIHKKFKQPIAFYFVKGTISSAKLSVLIKNIIQAVRSTGFDILATVCDQGPTNMGALKILTQSSSNNIQEVQNSFNVEGKRVLIIYDVPHLFKSIRNNFWNCGEMIYDGKKATWAHLVKVEEKNRSLLYLSKISPQHVSPNYRAKMKVKLAAQTLSTTVAAVLKLLAEAEPNMEQNNKIRDTALVVQELDRLFDATNGPSCSDEIKKGFRENVSTKTNHLEKWADYRRKLNTVKFVKNDQESRNVRCINGYQVTLSTFQDLWHHVHDIGFKYLNLRQLNQDALENMFGLIRQHSPTNKNPTCSGFIGALKTAVVSGMTAPHNPGSNCQKDNKKLLTSFHDLVFDKPSHETLNKENLSMEQQNTDCLESENQILGVFHVEDDDFQDIENVLESSVDNQAVVYVSGYLASILIKDNKCNLCMGALIAKREEIDNKMYSYIKLREWWPEKTSLTYPSIALCRLVDRAINMFEIEIIPRLHEINICQLTVTLFLVSCDTEWLTCTHSKDMLNAIYMRLGHLLIRRQCARVNQNLSQNEEALASTCKKAQQQGTAK